MTTLGCTYKMKEEGCRKPSKKGMQQEKIEVAQKGIQKGWDNETIADLTGLSVEQIQELRNQ
jgi:predicted transposase/invertase (TIGR01784 family)